MKKNVRKKFTITEDQAGERLDVFLSDAMECTRSQAQKLIRHSEVLVDDAVPQKTGMRVEVGMSIIVDAAPNRKEKVVVNKKNTRKMTFEHDPIVVAETPDYLVVNKPAGMLIHPTQANEPGTLAHWVVATYPEIAKVGESSARPGLVHRIDKDVSGLLVVARNQKMFDHLKKQFKERSIEKEYRALVQGVIETDADTLTFPIDRGPDGRMVARPIHDEITLQNVSDVLPGRRAVTHFNVLERFARYTLLDVKIETGRTHQIRVHLFAYGHPVVGDTLYMQKRYIKKSDPELDRILLHSYTLCFHDLKNEKKCFTADLPKTFKEFLENIS